jgi:lipopolysaccharide biosynthesis regulator YciM
VIGPVLVLSILLALAIGFLVGRYHLPDDRELRRSARHSRRYVRAISALLARDRDAAVAELAAVVGDQVVDIEPYFALGALFRARGEWERAIRVHQSIAMREDGNKRVRLRARYELALDLHAAGMPRRALVALEECLAEDARHELALRTAVRLAEELGRHEQAAELSHRLEKLGGGAEPQRSHLQAAAARDAMVAGELDRAARHLRGAEKRDPANPHVLVTAAELRLMNGDPEGAIERLCTALVAAPALAYVLPPLLLVALHRAGAGAARRSPGGRWSGARSRSALLPEPRGALPTGGLATAAATGGEASWHPVAGSAVATGPAPYLPARPPVDAAQVSPDAAPPGVQGRAPGPEAQEARGEQVSGAAGATREAAVAVREAGGGPLPEDARAPRRGERAAGRPDSTPALAGMEEDAGRLALPAGAAGAPSAPAVAAAVSRASSPGTFGAPGSALREVAGWPGGEPWRRWVAEAAGADRATWQRAVALLRGLVAAGEPHLALAACELESELDASEAIAHLRQLVEREPQWLPARCAMAHAVLRRGDGGVPLLAPGDRLEQLLRPRWGCRRCAERSAVFGWRCAGCGGWGQARPVWGAEDDTRPRPRRVRPGRRDWPAAAATASDPGEVEGERPSRLPGPRRAVSWLRRGWQQLAGARESSSSGDRPG